MSEQLSDQIVNGILIVEDDMDASFILEHKLQKINIPVAGKVTTGEDAVEKAKTLSPDLILMDIMLQGEMDGIEAAEIITENYYIPIIFLSAYSDDEIISRAATSEQYGYLVKPVDSRQLSVSINVTLRQFNLQRQLDISRTWFRETIFGVDDAVLTTDRNGYVDFANPSALRLTGKTRNDILGRPLNRVLSIHNISGEDITPNVVNKASTEVTYQREECSLVINKSSPVPVETTVIPVISYKSMIGAVILLNDISERKQYEEELLKTRDALEHYKKELQQLSDHLWNVQEKERVRISREIHDELSQNLARIRMDIQSAHSRISDESIRQLLTDTTGLVSEAITSVRRIATELRPKILDDVGLVAAIEWQIQQLTSRHELKIDFNSDTDEYHIDSNMAVDIFRIAQEALHNILKHAGADIVDVSLYRHQDTLNMKVSDNGKGFDQKSLPSIDSLGIVGMRERTLRWNGNFSIASEPEVGTTLEISLPLNHTSYENSSDS